MADTNQLNHTVDLNLIVKNVETEELGNIIKQPHKIGDIGELNIYLDHQDSIPTNTLKFKDTKSEMKKDLRNKILNGLSEL